MSNFLAELIGTGLLILLGDGVVANVVLAKTKGFQSGWIVITLGWGMAVFVGVYTVAPFSGAHINPAVTFALALEGGFPWPLVPVYVAGQMAGAFIGAVLVYYHYRSHFAATEDQNLKLGVFCTGPQIRRPGENLLSEIIGTFVLVFAVHRLTGPNPGLGALDSLPVALVVLVIGLSLGGTTGYAINPARDLAPRIAHAILPIPNKRDSDWSYSWIPVIGPLIGAALATGIYIATK